MSLRADRFHAALLPMFRHAQNGGFVLASNTRAERFFKGQYGTWVADGQKAWRSPQILQWSAWLRSCWLERVANGAESRLLLSSAQERVLWEKCAGAENAAYASLAQKAWKLLWDHGATVAELSQRLEFSGWARRFEKALADNGWLSEAQLADVLNRTPETREYALLLAGFDSLQPTQRKLLEGVRWSGSAVRHPEAGAPKCGSSADLGMSILAAAQWARERLQQEPEARLGITAPNVAAVRGPLGRALEHALGPDAFEFSLGLGLEEFPFVAAALALLRWGCGTLRLDEITPVLLSPFLGTSGECSLRARYDADLRREFDGLLPELSLAEFNAKLAWGVAKGRWAGLAPLLNAGRHAESIVKDIARPRRPSEWSVLFAKYLRAWGLDVQTGATNSEYRVQQRWHELLDEVSQLDVVMQNIPAERALSLVERLAAEEVFAPESRNVPVAVVGALESAGSLFDAVWMLDATAANWPPGGAANPLLPPALQRQYEMPHGSPAIDFAAGKIITQRLAGSAAEATFVWPRGDKDGELRPSPLLRGMANAELPQGANAALPCATREETDERPVVWTPERGRLNAYVLRDQAGCGFKAFAAKRLQAKPLASPGEGMDAMDRGSMVHDLLQLVWAGKDSFVGLGSLTELKRLSQNELHAFVRERAVSVLGEATSGWKRAFHQLEAERLTALVMEWLEVERKRGGFTLIEAEKKVSFEIAGLQFSVKVDRRDRVGENAYVVIDYKTGKTALSTKSWDDPLTEPQLPLYSEFATKTDGETLVGVAFAALVKNKMKFCGLVTRDGVLPGLNKSKQPLKAEQQLRWRAQLVKLTTDFRNGVSAAAPIGKACEYCDFPGLCRIAEKGGKRDADERDGDGDD